MEPREESWLRADCALILNNFFGVKDIAEKILKHKEKDYYLDDTYAAHYLSENLN